MNVWSQLEDWPPPIFAIVGTSNFAWIFWLGPSYGQSEHVLLLRLARWWIIEWVITFAVGCRFFEDFASNSKPAIGSENGCNVTACDSSFAPFHKLCIWLNCVEWNRLNCQVKRKFLPEKKRNCVYYPLCCSFIDLFYLLVLVIVTSFCFSCILSDWSFVHFDFFPNFLSSTFGLLLLQFIFLIIERLQSRNLLDFSCKKGKNLVMKTKFPK